MEIWHLCLLHVLIWEHYSLLITPHRFDAFVCRHFLSLQWREVKCFMYVIYSLFPLHFEHFALINTETVFTSAKCKTFFAIFQVFFLISISAQVFYVEIGNGNPHTIVALDISQS